MRRIAAVFAALALLAGPAAAVEANLEELLRSDNPAQIRQALAIVNRDAGRIDPVNLFLMAAKLQQQKENDEALFWFLAGQLRMRYVLSVAPEETRGQVFASMMAGLGMAIYPAFEMKEERIAATIDRVLAWDRSTEIDFTWNRDRLKLDKAQWPAAFEGVREGLRRLKAEFLALPKDECARLRGGQEDVRTARAKQQRLWDSPENRRRAQSEFSTDPVRVTTGGIAFRMPMNYLNFSRMPRSEVDYRNSDIPVKMFWPQLSGYTRENWSDWFDPAKIQVGILPTSQFPFMANYAALVAKAGLPLREASGLKVYAHPSAHKCFPQEILAGAVQAGEPVYIECGVQAAPRLNCNAYFYGADKSYTVSLFFNPDLLLDRWTDMVARVGAKVESWRHAAR